MKHELVIHPRGFICLNSQVFPNVLHRLNTHAIIDLPDLFIWPYLQSIHTLAYTIHAMPLLSEVIMSAFHWWLYVFRMHQKEWLIKINCYLIFARFMYTPIIKDRFLMAVHVHFEGTWSTVKWFQRWIWYFYKIVINPEKNVVP